MKKLLTLMVFMAMASAVQAQYEEGDFTIMPRAGLTVSNLSDGDKWKPELTFGVDFEHFVADEFSFSGGVLFTKQGCIYNYLDEDTKSGEEVKLHVYYGAIPIMANYYVLPGLALKAGIQPAFRVKAKIQQGGSSIDLDKALSVLYSESDVKINTFDFSIPVGLAYEYKGITLDARYNIGLTNLISGAETVRHSVFVLTLGYKISQ